MSQKPWDGKWPRARRPPGSAAGASGSVAVTVCGPFGPSQRVVNAAVLSLSIRAPGTVRPVISRSMSG
ncbi:hypothetical protein ACFQV2_07950 [Actinokineospora soli]|uniref:Uncharacterized protein n=1 Tax=Actinokineospora soli TaxID=1048753 RepID=A0ABW2TKQ5_9PSEU